MEYLRLNLPVTFNDEFLTKYKKTLQISFYQF